MIGTLDPLGNFPDSELPRVAKLLETPNSEPKDSNIPSMTEYALNLVRVPIVV